MVCRPSQDNLVWSDHEDFSGLTGTVTAGQTVAECGCAVWPDCALLNCKGRKNELDCLGNLTNGGTLAVVKLQAALCQDLQHQSLSQHGFPITCQTRHTCNTNCIKTYKQPAREWQVLKPTLDRDRDPSHGHGHV